MDVQAETEVAMAKAIMTQMSAQSMRTLKEALRQEMLDELRDEALELAKAELEETFTRRRERLQDELAKVKAQLEDEMLGEVDRQRDQLRQEVGDEWQEKFLTVRDERDAARGERDRAEAVLLALVKQLLPGERKIYLHSCGIMELDRQALNATLARHGVQVRSKATYSERLVSVRIDQARVAGHTQFWLTATTPAGVTDEDDSAEAGEA